MQDFSHFWGKKVLLSVLIWLFLLSKSLDLLEPHLVLGGFWGVFCFYSFQEPSPSSPRGLQCALAAEALAGAGLFPIPAGAFVCIKMHHENTLFYSDMQIFLTAELSIWTL